MARLKVDLGFSLKRIDLVIRGLTNTSFLGNYKSVFKGSGLEFSDYRTYNPGSDDASLIDWKVSRRVNQIIVKEFAEERNLEVIFLVDVSSQMLMGSAKKLKAEYVAEFVASLSRSILESGDSVGLVLFSNKIVKETLPQMGMQQFYSMTNMLTNVNNYGGYSNIDNVIDYVFKKMNEGSLVILVSDFVYGLEKNKHLKLASHKFDFISVMVRDPVDFRLPKGVGEVVLEDPYSGSQLLINSNSFIKEYAHDANVKLNKLKRLHRNSGADFLLLETDKPFVKEIIKFFKKRSDEWR